MTWRSWDNDVSDESRRSRRPVAVVQHQESVPPGLITSVLEASGVDHFVFEAWRRSDWPEAGELGALIVMGGTMNVDDLRVYPFLRRSRELMAEAIARGLATLGVCLGSQMMARVLETEVSRAEKRNAFFSELELTPAGLDDPLLAPFADGVQVLQFHEDTFVVPDDATVLATSAKSALPQAFRHGEQAYGVQFHFEVDADIVRRWIRDIGPAAMVQDWGSSEEELLDQAERHMEAQAEAGRNLVRRFAGIGELVS